MGVYVEWFSTQSMESRQPPTQAGLQDAWFERRELGLANATFLDATRRKPSWARIARGDELDLHRISFRERAHGSRGRRKAHWTPMDPGSGLAGNKWYAN